MRKLLSAYNAMFGGIVELNTGTAGMKTGVEALKENVSHRTEIVGKLGRPKTASGLSQSLRQSPAEYPH